MFRHGILHCDSVVLSADTSTLGIKLTPPSGLITIFTFSMCSDPFTIMLPLTSRFPAIQFLTKVYAFLISCMLHSSLPHIIIIIIIFSGSLVLFSFCSVI
jgi:hypothetical protein